MIRKAAPGLRAAHVIAFIAAAMAVAAQWIGHAHAEAHDHDDHDHDALSCIVCLAVDAGSDVAAPSIASLRAPRIYRTAAASTPAILIARRAERGTARAPPDR